MKDLLNKNYKALIEGIIKYTKLWKIIPCSWIGRSNIAKIYIAPKEI